MITSSQTKIDKNAGVIRGVSVITMGEALGHSVIVDTTTLQQIEQQGREKKKVPVKINHKSGVDAVCGHLINFRRAGNQVLADWKLLKSHPSYATILETAEEQPETVGLSVSFTGPELRPGQVAKSARVEELLSVDFVTLPAANPSGLFSRRINGRVHHLASRRVNFAGLGPIAAILVAQRAKAAAAKAARAAIKSPLAQAAAGGIAGAATSKLLRDRAQKKREEEEQRLKEEEEQKQLSRTQRKSGVGFRERKAAPVSMPSTKRPALNPTPMHLEAITEAISELSRVPGPVRRPERAGPTSSTSSPQARDNDGKFTPGAASSAETMRDAYVKPKPGLATRLRALQIAKQRASQNSEI